MSLHIHNDVSPPNFLLLLFESSHKEVHFMYNGRTAMEYGIAIVFVSSKNPIPGAKSCVYDYTLIELKRNDCDSVAVNSKRCILWVNKF